MTALIIVSIVLGALLGLAALGIPLWLASKAPTPEADLAEAREYLRAKAAAAAPAITLPAPRRPAEVEVRPGPQRVA